LTELLGLILDRSFDVLHPEEGVILLKQPDDATPIRWNPCAAVHYKISLGEIVPQHVRGPEAPEAERLDLPISCRQLHRRRAGAERRLAVVEAQRRHVDSRGPAPVEQR